MQSTVIQAFITANRIGCYEGKLKPDAVYKIKNFLVAENKTNYRVSSHKFLIQFTQQTRLDQIVEADTLKIQRQKFRIHSFTEFEEAVDMNVDLYGKYFVVSMFLIISTCSNSKNALYRCHWKAGPHQQ